MPQKFSASVSLWFFWIKKRQQESKKKNKTGERNALKIAATNAFAFAQIELRSDTLGAFRAGNYLIKAARVLAAEKGACDADDQRQMCDAVEMSLI